jgi:hypothetical protein
MDRGQVRAREGEGHRLILAEVKRRGQPPVGRRLLGLRAGYGPAEIDQDLGQLKFSAYR